MAATYLGDACPRCNGRARWRSNSRCTYCHPGSQEPSTNARTRARLQKLQEEYAQAKHLRVPSVFDWRGPAVDND